MGVLKVKDALGNWVPVGVGVPANSIETFLGTHIGGAVTNAAAKVVANVTIPARGYNRMATFSGWELCNWATLTTEQTEITPWVNGATMGLNLRGIPGTTIIVPAGYNWFAIAANATALIEVKAQMISATTRDYVNGGLVATCFAVA